MQPLVVEEKVQKPTDRTEFAWNNLLLLMNQAAAENKGGLDIYTIPYAEALNCIQPDGTFVYKDYKGKLGNRMRTPLLKGNKCTHCDVPITHIAVQKHKSQPKGKYHLNAWSNSILMTSDHIVPKALGGPDDLENRQVLCCKCNNKRGCLIETKRPKELGRLSIMDTRVIEIIRLEEELNKDRSNLNISLILPKIKVLLEQ